MSDWLTAIVNIEGSIKDAVVAIDSAAQKIALVADSDRRLLGTISDGDVRRGLLKGSTLQDPLRSLVNTHPLCVTPEDEPLKVLALMRARGIHQMPVVNTDGIIVGLHTIGDLLKANEKTNPVVLMAGGLGSRLRPLTDNCPKPLLNVGDRPILETILLNFIEHGFRNFYISVNYKADQIIKYFGDGSKWGVSITYIHEQQRLGTAGALSLLPEKPSEPIFVMNGDILARINFGGMLDFHNSHGAIGTLGMRQFSHTIPYGVVKVDDHRLVSIVEKPEETVFVSAGVYVLSPECLNRIPSNTFYDMPTLFQDLMETGLAAIGFPIHEYWIDIGRIEDYERASREYGGVFSD